MALSAKDFAAGLAAATLLAANPAYAWDGINSGKVLKIDTTAANNYSTRIYLVGGPSLCGPGTPSWAYVNTSDGNYQGYLANILTAFAAQRSVDIYTTKDAAGYCQIGYIGIY